MAKPIFNYTKRNITLMVNNLTKELEGFETVSLEYSNEAESLLSIHFNQNGFMLLKVTPTMFSYEITSSRVNTSGYDKPIRIVELITLIKVFIIPSIMYGKLSVSVVGTKSYMSNSYKEIAVNLDTNPSVACVYNASLITAMKLCLVSVVNISITSDGKIKYSGVGYNFSKFNLLNEMRHFVEDRWISSTDNYYIIKLKKLMELQGCIK